MQPQYSGILQKILFLKQKSNLQDVSSGQTNRERKDFSMESASTAQKNSGERIFLVEGSYKDLILKLSLPAVVIIMVMIVYNMADTFFIGRTGDPNKVATVSIAELISQSGTNTFFCPASALAGFAILMVNAGTI